MSLAFKIITVLLIEIGLIFFYKRITPTSIAKTKFDYRSILKGVIERAFLSFGFLNNIPHVLTLFGALKLGTRLKHGDKEETEEGLNKESLYNDFYLIGNFVSVSASIVYYIIFQPKA